MAGKGILQTGWLAGRGNPWGLVREGLQDLLFQLHSHQDVEMVSKQAIGVSIHNRLEMLYIQIQKVMVITFLDEDIPAVDAAIVDMVPGAV